MISTAPAIIKRAKTDRIASMLKQQSGGNRILKYGSEFQEPELPAVEPTPIPNVGQYNTPGYLPSGSGAPDPTVTATSGPQTVPSDYWTRIDPNMGYVNPTLSIDPSQGSGLFPGEGAGPAQMPTVGPQGPFPGGNMGGPQGSVYGINPVTGNTIYNVTGSPRPGFFDSTLGKITKGVGTGALNAFLPGAGFVAGKIFDAARRASDRRNTGTDLSSRYNPNTQAPRQPSAPGGPAWFQPGYKLPSGIQDAINRGDYSRAYGPSEQSLASSRVAASQAYGGNPNNTRSFASEGRFMIDAEGAPKMHGAMYGDRRGEFRMPQGGPPPRVGNTDAVNQWLMQQPAYLKFMQRGGG